MKVWVASGLTPFVAVIVTAYVPPEPAAGVPESVAVPSPLSVNVTPAGKPVADNAHVGVPADVAADVKVTGAPGWPTGIGGGGWRC